MTHTTEGFYICTNAIDIFHTSEVKDGRNLTTGQPYVLFGETEDEVFGKAFVNPTRDIHGEFDMTELTPKSAADIISNKI